MKTLVLFSILLIQNSAIKSKFPFITCHPSREPSNFNQCLSNAVVDAIKKMREPLVQFGLPSLDALVLPFVNLDLGTNDETLHVTFFKYTTYGIIDNIEDLQASMDFSHNILTVSIHESSLTCTFDCYLNGYLDSQKITGWGSGALYTVHPIYTYTFYLKVRGDHYRVANTTCQVTSQITVEKIREFDGSVTASKLNRILNGNNNHLLMLEINDEFEPVLAKAAGMFLDKILKKVTIGELFGI